MLRLVISFLLAVCNRPADDVQIVDLDGDGIAEVVVVDGHSLQVGPERFEISRWQLVPHGKRTLLALDGPYGHQVYEWHAGALVEHEHE